MPQSIKVGEYSQKHANNFCLMLKQSIKLGAYGRPPPWNTVAQGSRNNTAQTRLKRLGRLGCRLSDGTEDGMRRRVTSQGKALGIEAAEFSAVPGARAGVGHGLRSDMSIHGVGAETTPGFWSAPVWL